MAKSDTGFLVDIKRNIVLSLMKKSYLIHILARMINATPVNIVIMAIFTLL